MAFWQADFWLGLKSTATGYKNVPNRGAIFLPYNTCARVPENNQEYTLLEKDGKKWYTAEALAIDEIRNQLVDSRRIKNLTQNQ